MKKYCQNCGKEIGKPGSIHIVGTVCRCINAQPSPDAKEEVIDKMIESCKYREPEVLDLTKIDYPKLAGEIRVFLERQLHSQRQDWIEKINRLVNCTIEQEAIKKIILTILKN